MHHLAALFLFQRVQGATWEMSVLLGWMKQVLFPLGLELFNDKGSKATPNPRGHPNRSPVFQRFSLLQGLSPILLEIQPLDSTANGFGIKNHGTELKKMKCQSAL